MNAATVMGASLIVLPATVVADDDTRLFKD
jgi:hypothetical protein